MGNLLAGGECFAYKFIISRNDVLGSVGSVVHQQQLKVLDVVDEESLVAGGGQETGLLVGAVADL